MNEIEEAHQIRRAQEGDEAALGWLIARFRQSCVRLAAHTLHHPCEAEDVAQEAFIRAFRGLKSFRGDSSFRTWLFRIVVRTCLNRLRQARWRTEIALETAAEQGHASAPETRVLVHTLLDRLSPPMRAALVLRELDGLEYEDIARVLDIPVGTVRSRLSAAREQFRILYEAVQEETRNA